MSRTRTLVAATLAALLVGGTSAHAGCKLAQLANKKWIMTATDTGAVSKVLIYCKLITSAAGTVAYTPNGCVAYNGASPDYSTPFNFDLISATLTQNPHESCVFDLDVALFAPAAQTLKARLVMESGKTSAAGTWLSNFSSYGTITISRQ